MTQRIWITKPNRWKEAVEKNYLSERPLKTTEIKNGIVLPVLSDVGGGCVCDEHFQCQAGLAKNFITPYKVPKKNLLYRPESVVFGGVLWHHFGHFFTESMNRLWWFLENPNDSRKIVFTCTARAWHANYKGGGAFLIF